MLAKNKILFSALLCAFISLLVNSANARTLPRQGAVRKSSHFGLQAPFPCGVEVRINCAYGPNCSPAHKRTTGNITNDYFALDMIRMERGNGHNKPVVAAASGIVRYAGWAPGGWAPYGKIVYLEHSYSRDGHKTYQSLYGHLHSITVHEGQAVEQGQIIGTLGGSSKGELNKLGAHLHFALYQNAQRKPLGGGIAVVPEPLGKYEDLHDRMELVSCGDPQKDFVATLLAQQPAAIGGLINYTKKPESSSHPGNTKKNHNSR